MTFPLVFQQSRHIHDDHKLVLMIHGREAWSRTFIVPHSCSDSLRLFWFQWMSVDSVGEQNSLTATCWLKGFPFMFNKNPVLVVKVVGFLSRGLLRDAKNHQAQPPTTHWMIMLPQTNGVFADTPIHWAFKCCILIWMHRFLQAYSDLCNAWVVLNTQSQTLGILGNHSP